MIIIYYSRGASFPALLAALKHCRPALTLQQARRAAADWREESALGERQPSFLQPLGETAAGEIVCFMTADVPPPVIRRTFNGLGALMGSTTVLTAAYPLTWGSSGERGRGSRLRKACWREIEALVERTRLQARLMRDR